MHCSEILTLQNARNNSVLRIASNAPLSIDARIASIIYQEARLIEILC